MNEYHVNYTLIIMVIGGLIVLTMLIKSWLQRISVPPLVGFLVLGFAVRLAEDRWGFMGDAGAEMLDLLAKIGLITLLFRVGLESRLQGLVKQLRSASVVWVSNVLVSALFGFAAAHYLLGAGWITGLVVAAAFTATSVGISVAVWDASDALNSANGELLIDIAELDDISAVILMALLFSLVPLLQHGTGTELVSAAAGTAVVFLAKLFGFGLLCAVFSHFLEKPVTAYFKTMKPPPALIVVVVGIGFVIAALAEWIGFSLAIGAFFAGLVFSRDPAAVKREASFTPLYELFCPFFFIGIGMDVDPGALSSALPMGLLLSVAAIAAKMAADGLPVWMMRGFPSAVLIGVSMVPRAEIAMVIMQRGLKSGPWAVPQKMFNAMVIVTVLTCTLAPLCIQILFNRWPQTKEEK